MPSDLGPDLFHAARHFKDGLDPIRAVDVGAEAIGGALDWRAKTLRGFRPDRDLAGIAWWDASTLTGNNGDSISFLGDRSGNGYGLASAGAARPTLVASALNGKNVIRFGVAQYLISTLGLSVWNAPTRAQPITLFALVKFNGAGATNNSHVIMSSTGGSGLGMGAIALLNTSSGYDQWLYPFAGATGIGGGGSMIDGQWHTCIIKINSQGYTVMVDGQLTQTATTAAHGTGSLSGRLILGQYNTALSFPFDGDFAEGGYILGDVPLEICRDIAEDLRLKWLHSNVATPFQRSVIIDDFTDANGQAVRTLRTSAMTTTPRALMINHQQNGNVLLQSGVVGYSIAHAAAQEGYIVILSNNHGTDSWGSTLAINDGPAAEAAVNARYGITISGIVEGGFSMGGNLAYNRVRYAAYSAPVKALFQVDGAVNLEWAYRSSGYAASVISGFGLTAGTLAAGTAVNQVNFTSTTVFNVGDVVTVDRASNPEDVTITSKTGSGTFTYGISGGAGTGGGFAFTHASGKDVVDFPTKTAGRDPVKWTAAQFPNIRYQNHYSPNDLTVLKAFNYDVLQPLLASATTQEATWTSHPGGHLEVSAYKPSQLIDFLRRIT